MQKKNKYEATSLPCFASLAFLAVLRAGWGVFEYVCSFLGPRKTWGASAALALKCWAYPLQSWALALTLCGFYGFSPEVLGFSPQVLGFRLEVVGFSVEVGKSEGRAKWGALAPT